MILYTSAGTKIIAGEAIRTVPPQQLPVAVYDVKQRRRLTSDAETDMLIGLIEQATSYVENYTGLGLITQIWQERFSAWPDGVSLAKRPVQSIISIGDLTVGGSPNPLVNPAIYRLVGTGSQRAAAMIVSANGQSWPAMTATMTETIEVIYVVGFGDQPEDVPAMLRQAIQMLVGIWFESREASDLEPVHNLLADWRPLGVA
jgi:uncharacterized phiE125 gp8 family phage protein